MLIIGRWSKVLVVFLLLIVLFLFAGGWQWVGKIAYPLPYKEHIFRYSKQFQVDPLFVTAVMRVESRFYAEAHSRRGAKGLMQLMPETAEWITQQLNIEYRADMLTEPKYNIMLGTWYISNLSAQFNDNLLLTLAAYNGGRGRVKEWLEDKVWDGKQENISQIPFEETKKFVTRVWRDYQLYQKLYGGYSRVYFRDFLELYLQ